MKLEQQVCSLEWAKKLKEARVLQESLFWYFIDGSKDLIVEMKPGLLLDEDGRPSQTLNRKTQLISAYTVGELGEMLPRGYFTRKHFGSGTKKWHWTVSHGYEDNAVNGELIWYDGYTSDTEADTRAACLHSLITNKLLDVKTLQCKKEKV